MQQKKVLFAGVLSIGILLAISYFYMKQTSVKTKTMKKEPKILEQTQLPNNVYQEVSHQKNLIKQIKQMNQWKTAEHYFQAQKFLNDISLYKKIYNASSAKEALEIAQKNKDRMREDWWEINLVVMCKVVYEKFSQNDFLKNLLLSTRKQYLIEDSPTDSFWGIGNDGKGRNYLGKILMYVRALISEDKPFPFFQSNYALEDALGKATPKNPITDSNAIYFYDKNKGYYAFTNFYQQHPIFIESPNIKTSVQQE